MGRFSATSSPSNGESGKTKGKSLPTSRAGLNMDQLTEPVTVHFQWEKIPGRCKHDSGPDHRSPRMESVSPMRPPGRSLSAAKTTAVKEPVAGSRIRPLNKTYSCNDNLFKIDYIKLVKDKKRGIGVKDDYDAGDNDDEHGDVYSDAIHTLSETESLSMSCSVSAVSGFDTSTLRQRGTFSTDPQTRDFMMSRFLPAAKAMALLPSQFHSRKQNTTVEKNPLLCQPPTNISLYYAPYKEGEEESEEEDEGPENIEKNSAKRCRSFPRLCFKNSWSILVPIAGMKIKKQLLHSTPDMDKSAVKKVWDAVCRKKLVSQSESPDIREARSKFSHSSRFNYSGELQKIGRSSPFRSSRYSGLSPCRSRTPQPPLRRTKFPGCSKESVYDKPVRSHSAGRASKIHLHVSQEREAITASHIVEKILHMDNVNAEILQGNRSKEFKLEQELNSQEKSCERMKNDAGCAVLSPLPPPLPKSPSESWLLRTLSAISFKNSFPYSSYGTRPPANTQNCDTSSANTKWQTMVKTSNSCHNHVCYSEELVSHVTQHQ